MQVSSGRMVLIYVRFGEIYNLAQPNHPAVCFEVGDCGFSLPEYVPYIGRTGLLSPGISPPLLNLVLPIFAFAILIPVGTTKLFLIIIDIINDIFYYYNISCYNQSKWDREGGKT